MSIVRCEHPECNNGVDTDVWPGEVRADGTYNCGLHCECGALRPCPRVHEGTFTREDVEGLRSIAVAERNLVDRGDIHAATRLQWVDDLAKRIEALLPPETP